MTASVSLDSNPMALKWLSEKHGITPTTVCAHAKLLDPSNPSKYGVNLDTENCRLGGSDPVEFARHFKSQIQHIHWKDMPAEMEEQRGQVYGAAMAPVVLWRRIYTLLTFHWFRQRSGEISVLTSKPIPGYYLLFIEYSCARYL